MLKRAWAEIKESRHVLLGTDETKKLRLAVIIANLASVTNEEDELSARAIERFLSRSEVKPKFTEPFSQ